jgi:hypothetical protein
MNLPVVLFAARWFLRDTLRQARAAGVTPATLTATFVCACLCLTVSIAGAPAPTPGASWETPNILPRNEAAKLSAKELEGVDVAAGEMTLLFGTFRVPIARNRDDAIHFVEVWLAGGVADTAGVLLALVWTAGFLPTFLDPATATILFAKPMRRWGVLVGKFLSVLVYVAAQALLFIAALWLALAVRTGVWDARVFAAVPVFVFHFGCFYAVSASLAAFTRSTAAAVLGTVFIWFGCWAVNYARNAANPADGLLEAAYWLLPKPAEFGAFLIDILGAQGTFPASATLGLSAIANPEAVVLSSCLLPLAVLALAGWWLQRTEY